MKKQYLIYFQYEDVTYGFEGEEECYISVAHRYLTGFDAREDFMQTLDMAGDEHTQVLFEKSVPMWKHDLCHALAKIVMVLGGYKYKNGTNLFYWLLRKGLVDVARDPMCEKFDDKAYAWR